MKAIYNSCYIEICFIDKYTFLTEDFFSTGARDTYENYVIFLFILVFTHNFISITQKIKEKDHD